MFKIGGSTSKEAILDMLDLYFQYWELDIEEIQVGERYELIIKVLDGYVEEDFYRILSDLVEEVIITEYMDKIIGKRVDRIYEGDYSPLDRATLNLIKDEIRTSPLYLDEKLTIKEELIDYLKTNEYIDILGYVRFRLVDYVYILDIAIDNIISRLQEERQIEEFMDMIKYLVEIRPAKEDILNVIIKDGDFTLRNIDNEPVGTDIIDKVELQFSSSHFTKSDILLSALIIMAPKRVFLHFEKGKDLMLIQAITEIFKGKIVHCHGCNICNINTKIE